MEKAATVPPHMSRANEAAARHRKGVCQLESSGRTEKDHKMKVEVSQKIAEVLAAARQRNEKLSPRQQLKKRAEQALKAAKYRGASPETRKRYELEKTLEDRATKALSEAVARATRATCTVNASHANQLSGLRHDLPWRADQHEAPAGADLMWQEEEYGPAWTEAAQAAQAAQVGHDASHGLEDYGGGYDAGWAQDGYQDASLAPWSAGGTDHWGPGHENLFGTAPPMPLPQESFMRPEEQPSRWTAKARFLPQPPTRSEETEALRTWAETTTAASSNRSVASAADSNSETGLVNDDDDADELLASCWKAVAEAEEV